MGIFQINNSRKIFNTHIIFADLLVVPCNVCFDLTSRFNDITLHGKWKDSLSETYLKIIGLDSQ